MHADMQMRFESIFSLRVANVTPVAGGYTNRCWCVEASDGRRFFVKESPPHRDAFLCEADGLKALASVEGVAMPKLYFVDETLLVLEWVSQKETPASSHQNLGRMLAYLHGSRGPAFGWSHDNYIGTTPQDNTWYPCGAATAWAEFFLERRIKHQLRHLRAKGFAELFTKDELRRLEQGVIDELSYDQPPALLHGDLWSGNYLVGKGGEVYLIDPAVYYGDPEADLALTRLFGGFAAEFYEAYSILRPYREGWERREPFYQLYHLLNHVNMLGRSYLEPTRQCLGRCLMMS